MSLRIELRGRKSNVVVSSLPRAFVARLFRHCLGKNNTPYFANNCFKGVLYFDNPMARRHAEQAGYEWRGWRAEDRFYRHTGYVLDREMELCAVTGSAERAPLSLPGLCLEVEHVALEGMLSSLAGDEVLILLGTVDKGEEIWALEDFRGPFDPDRLTIGVHNLECLYVEEPLVSGMAYAGQTLARVSEASRGKNVLDPVLLSRDGQELDLYDFLSD